MNYMIAEPDKKSSYELKRSLDDYEKMNFKGSFANFEIAKNSICKEPPDLVFIRMGTAGLNAYELLREIREKKLFTKVIFISIHEEDAVDAFECEADGFLLAPVNGEKMKHLLLGFMDKKSV